MTHFLRRQKLGFLDIHRNTAFAGFDGGVLYLLDEHVLDHVLPRFEMGAVGNDVAEPARPIFRKAKNG